jgi:hypothetical protein
LKSVHNVRSAHSLRSIGIVGESYFQDAIARCVIGQSVALITEPGNPINPCAIMVWNDEGHQIGYLPLGSWVAGAMPPRGLLYMLGSRPFMANRRSVPSSWTGSISGQESCLNEDAVSIFN